MDLGGQTFAYSISLQSQVNVRLVLGSEEFHVKRRLLIADLALGKRDECHANVLSYGGANRILAFNATIAVSCDKEMSSYHARVIVPSLEIVDGFPIDILESESSRVVIDTFFRADFESLVLDLLLAFDHTDNECFYDVESGLRVMPWALDLSWNID